MIEVLENIPIKIRLEDVMGVLKLGKKNSSIEQTVVDLLEKAASVARPEALYKISYIDSKNGDTVTMSRI